MSVFKMLNGEKVLNTLVNLFLKEDRPCMAAHCILVDSENFNKDNYTFASLYRLRRYTRRFPLGSHPSAKVVALAEKYCMKLEDGYTFVEQFERKRSIKVRSKSTAYEEVIS